MTDMTLSDLSAELRMYEGRPEGIHVDHSAFAVWADAIDAHLAKAAQPVAYRYALSTGKWTVFISKARAKFLSDEGAVVEPLYAAPPTAAPAQPVEAVGEDSREFVLRAMAMNYSDRHAWDHLDADACRRGADEIKALRGALEAIAERHGDKSVDGQIARAALAHPRPAGDAHPDDLAVDAFASAMKEKLAAARTKGRGGWNTDDASNRDLSIALRKHVDKGDPRDVANFAMFIHQRGESIMPSPTGEQAGDVIDWTDDDVETLRCLRDAVGKYANLKKLWVPTIEKMLTRARQVENATAMPYAKPRPVGLPDGWEIEEDSKGFVRIASPECDLHIGFMPPPSLEATTMLRDLACALLAATPDGEVG